MLRPGDRYGWDGGGKYYIFCGSEELVTVEIVGGVHKTISSLHLESWKNEMRAEIDRINRILPTVTWRVKTFETQRWIESVLRRMEHYKAEHRVLLKEAMVLLELALWKAKLDEQELLLVVDDDDSLEAKTLQLIINEYESARGECRVTCGADVVIKNVLPFLELE